jgi:glycine cleavage system H protein
MNYPESYRYTKEHEWVHLEGGIASIGITHHAQEELGDIVYVDLPKAGAATEKGKSFGSVESVKAVSDLYSPVTGEVAEVNELLSTAPETLNSDPHGAGWLIKVKTADEGEIGDLMTASEYEAYAGAES